MMQSESLTVLLIDDDEDDYQIVRSLLFGLSFSSFKLRWAPAFEAGLTALKQNQHDVCLLDYQLESQNGLELLKEAVENEVRTPIVFLTGHGNYQLDLEAMRVGAAGYLTKDQLSGAVLERSIRCAMEFARRRDELLRAKRVIRSLSQCNEAVIRIKDELELLKEICRIVIEVGGYRMAWIGYAQESVDRSVTPVAQYGFDAGYLEAAKITWHDTERGRGPTGISVRTGKPSIVRYDEHHPDLSPWRAEAVKRGYVSAIALPLLVSGEVLGSLNIYSSEPNAFDAEEVDLLRQVAGNLSFGLEALRRHQAQNQAEKTLRENEERLRIFIEHSPVALAMFDRKMRYISFSRRWLGDYNLGERDLVGLSHYEVFPEITKELKAVHRRALSGEVVRAENDRFDRADGSVQWLRWEVRPWHDATGGIGGIVIFSEDITERRQTEEALRESRLDLNRAQAVAQIGSWRMDVGLNELLWSDEVYHIFGIPKETPLAYETFLGFIHPRDRDYVDRQWTAALRGAPYDIEHRILVRDSLKWVREKAELEFNKDGSLRGGFGTVQDITERKLAEAERQRLMAAIEQTGEMIVITNSEGNIEYVNPAFEWRTGYSREEVLGQNPSILNSGEHDEVFYRNLWETISSGRTWVGRMVNKRKDGTFFTENATISPVLDASGRTVNYVAVKRDITEEIRLAAQLQQAQKLESVGRLAGGVAHDYNNMLGVIIGYTELALDAVDPAERLHADLEEILKAANRSTAITRQLLAFARKQTISPVLLDLNQTVEGMLKMLRRLIGEDIDLAWLPKAGLWPIKMDPAQVDQILANLCVNARDAIAGVGKVTIETGRVVFDEAYCADHAGFIPGEFVLLAVSDNGCGMEKETLDYIFEPFFTTKDVDKGTGLGLATVYGIVKQNNGFTNVYSERDHGSTFKIYLPRAEVQPLKKAHTQETKKNLKGTEIVLLVEDEESNLALCKALLERHGYMVLAAGSPAEALSMAENHPGGIHLLLTDVVMPGMNGKDLKEKLSVFKPGLKCIFMSGYTANVIAHHGVLEEGIHFLQKPFSVKTLAEKVREVLDA
jgi:PAS domain S-box-containing protein